ncbi:GTP binding Elongation factor Tu family protein [Hibiscus syriacus]|uniref:GTP binding Elongation factor Tu family protein n=1 Tax=Hibiscus syriacus TaxID=106335 RepID=A0A6A3AGM5_HIBSY|nr:GTP binding Elongation factor Tu family protein [Hibiscus syriacus]
MMKLCLMASHGYPQGPGLVLHQEQGFRIKEGGSFFTSQIVNQDMVQIGSFDLRRNQFQELPKPVTALCEPKLFIDVDPTAQKPVIINKPDAYQDTELLGFGIAEKCRRHEKILKFLMSGSNELEKGELDLSLLSDLMGLQPVIFGMHQQPFDSYLIHPISKLDPQMPLPDFFGEIVHNSKVTVNPDGQVVLTACGTEMKDILSFISEFYLSSNSTKWRKQSQVVPYFDRKRIMKARAGTNLSSPQGEVASIAPLKSSDHSNGMDTRNI